MKDAILGAFGLAALWGIGWMLGIPGWQENGLPNWSRLPLLLPVAFAAVYTFVFGPIHLRRWWATRKIARRSDARTFQRN